ncbi:breast cancer metastasis-suppressor 1-like protein [Nilaparvata lugens]|uniref:breast cancer metastasis-suppressor 1-like protein n=1 Tax=Nilaparvata lugens TaxID=108931 RepID=UPI000B984905|nr:breast cancer metastasis-suppressor 1-like protein [Nilaparvata lugens]
MPAIKEDREDSDVDEMDHESGESDKSSSSCDSSDPASDSDDSSEMDTEECEKRRNACIDQMADLERQFTLVREQLYRERMSQVEIKLGEVKVGKAQEYLQPLEELQENMRIRIEVAGILRKYKLTNITNSFEAEELAAKQNFESEKCLLWDMIKEELEEKIRRLEEDRNSVDISADLWMCERSLNGGSGRGGSNWRRGGKDVHTRRKPVTVSGPYIIYMLNDTDLLQDWTTIKKALSSCKRKSELL